MEVRVEDFGRTKRERRHERVTKVASQNKYTKIEINT
jgi:hypothetical protein